MNIICVKVDSPCQMEIMILICKIFHMCNRLQIQPFLLNPEKFDYWLNVFIGILESRQD